MSRIITLGLLSIAGMCVALVARADCTHNAFALGRDAAKQACDDIAGRHYPGPIYEAPIYEEGATPERTCTLEQEIDCKNAMAQYTREHPKCGSLIRRNVPLYDLATGEPRGRAEQTWRTYMARTCAR